MKLAKEGYFGGDPGRVMKAPVDIVMQTLKFIMAEGEYLKAYRSVNEEM